MFVYVFLLDLKSNYERDEIENDELENATFKCEIK